MHSVHHEILVPRPSWRPPRGEWEVVAEATQSHHDAAPPPGLLLAGPPLLLQSHGRESPPPLLPTTKICIFVACRRDLMPSPAASRWCARYYQRRHESERAAAAAPRDGRMGTPVDCSVNASAATFWTRAKEAAGPAEAGGVLFSVGDPFWYWWSRGGERTRRWRDGQWWKLA
jgi:hypothetical protein